MVKKRVAGRGEQNGDPVTDALDDGVEVIGGVGGHGEQDREQGCCPAPRRKRSEASSMESLQVLRIPLEEAKTHGLDRTLCARRAHAELKPPPGAT